jgi:hypothetical protein
VTKESTPPSVNERDEDSTSGRRAMRRCGARREISDRVSMQSKSGNARTLEGWALNMSRGGLRVVLEDDVGLGEEFDITIGQGDVPTKQGRIVWIQKEADGLICGIEFLSDSGVFQSIPPAPPGSLRLPGIPEQDPSEVSDAALSEPPPK